jgi:hypothetical protein
MNNELIITFDFDGTLARPIVQEYARELICRGFNVHIVTTRLETGSGIYVDNSDLFEVARDLNISESNIKFTNMQYKSPTIKNLKSIIHFDDNVDELELINSNTDCIGLSVCGTTSWRAKAERILKMF